jgi:hypothetical protein
MLVSLFARAENMPLAPSLRYGWGAIDEKLRDCKWPNFLGYIMQHCNVLATLREGHIPRIDSWDLCEGPGVMESWFLFLKATSQETLYAGRSLN